MGAFNELNDDWSLFYHHYGKMSAEGVHVALTWSETLTKIKEYRLSGVIAPRGSHADHVRIP